MRLYIEGSNWSFDCTLSKIKSTKTTNSGLSDQSLCCSHSSKTCSPLIRRTSHTHKIRKGIGKLLEKATGPNLSISKRIQRWPTQNRLPQLPMVPVELESDPLVSELVSMDAHVRAAEVHGASSTLSVPLPADVPTTSASLYDEFHPCLFANSTPNENILSISPVHFNDTSEISPVLPCRSLAIDRTEQRAIGPQPPTSSPRSLYVRRIETLPCNFALHGSLSETDGNQTGPQYHEYPFEPPPLEPMRWERRRRTPPPPNEDAPCPGVSPRSIQTPPWERIPPPPNEDVTCLGVSPRLIQTSPWERTMSPWLFNEDGPPPWEIPTLLREESQPPGWGSAPQCRGAIQSLPCDHSDMVSTGKFQLPRHVKRLRPESPGPSQRTCRFCPKVFKRVDAKRKHEWEKHYALDCKPEKRKVERMEKRGVDRMGKRIYMLSTTPPPMEISAQHAKKINGEADARRKHEWKKHQHSDTHPQKGRNNGSYTPVSHARTAEDMLRDLKDYFQLKHTK